MTNLTYIKEPDNCGRYLFTSPWLSCRVFFLGDSRMDAKMQRCTKCGKLKPESEFKFRRDRNKINRWCKACYKEYGINYTFIHKEQLRVYGINYRKTHKKQRRVYCASHREQCNAHQRAWHIKHPGVKFAQNVINNGIVLKHIIRPKVCSTCGGNEYKIEAHHPDYSKPFDVIWLCSKCHRELHKAGKLK